MNALSLRVAGISLAALLALGVAAFAAAQNPRTVVESPVVEERALSSRETGWRNHHGEEVSRRHALAQAIVEGMAAEAGRRNLAHTWRASTLNGLLVLDSSALRELQAAGAYDDVVAGMAKASARSTHKRLGNVSQDVVYKPVTPCRLIDTRNVGGKISGVRAYNLDVAGNPYGGDPACNLAAIVGQSQGQVGALFLNITIIDPQTVPGFIAARKAGDTNLTSWVNWYQSGPAVQSANAGIVTTANAENAAQANSFEILSSGAVDVIVDLFGAFVRPEATALDCMIARTNDVMMPFGPPGPWVVRATCPAGYMATGVSCGADFQSAVHYFGPFGISLTTYECAFVKSNDGATAYVATSTTCCRVPGR